MKFATRQHEPSNLGVSDLSALPGLLDMTGTHVILGFRGTRIQVIASDNQEGQLARLAAVDPVTDPLHLELLSGAGEAVHWRRPVLLQAVIECRLNPFSPFNEPRAGLRTLHV